MITSAIKQLVEGRDLSGEEAHVAMMQVMSGDASPAQISAFLVALRMKGETPDEIAGCARAMRAHVTPASPSHSNLVDTCGTGGDGSDTFNISTSAALVAAAAGAIIAKHGNRAVSSRCGSADVLEALGVRIDLAPTDVAACIDEVGFGFLFAQAHHPAMRHAGPIRRELGIRSVFNLLGPLTNPAGARRQVVGVYSEALVVPIAQVLSKLGTEHALVVHGAGGLDELTPTGENLMAEVRNGSVSTSTLDPAPLSTGPVPGTPDDLRCGGDPAQNAAVILTVFDGERGPRRDAVILNAAAALLVGGRRDRLGGRHRPGRRHDRLRRGPVQARRADRVHPRARAGGVSGYLTRLSGDVRRDAPEPARGFGDALRAGAGVAVIAEIKRASPSEGGIAPAADVAGTARATPTAGPLRCPSSSPSATSAGAWPTCARPGRPWGCRRSPRSSRCFPSRSPPSGWPARMPILVLLALLSDDEAARLMQTAELLGMDALVEAHTAEEVERALGLDAAIVGVNARDLESLEVDRDRQLELLATLPPSVVRVAESGIASRADVEAARDAGADAVLVGTSLMRRPELLAELVGVAR